MINFWLIRWYASSILCVWCMHSCILRDWVMSRFRFGAFYLIWKWLMLLLLGLCCVPSMRWKSSACLIQGNNIKGAIIISLISFSNFRCIIRWWVSGTMLRSCTKVFCTEFTSFVNLKRCIKWSWSRLWRWSLILNSLFYLFLSLIYCFFDSVSSRFWVVRISWACSKSCAMVGCNNPSLILWLGRRWR